MNEFSALNFGENLKKLRNEHGLSMDSFCLAFNEKYDAKLNKSTVSRYENGSQEPIMSTAIKMAEFFSVDVSNLLYGKISSKAHRIPVLGDVAAGIPIEMIEDIIDYEEIPANWGNKEDFFCLQIKGDSMSPVFVDGDTVIVRKQESADTGDSVIAMINGDEATIKRLKRTEDGIILIPNNPQYLPMTYSNDQIKTLPVRILGKVVELRRKF